MTLYKNVDGVDLALTDEEEIRLRAEWADREDRKKHLDEMSSVEANKVSAQSALDASDIVAIRCFKAGVPFPAEWGEYVAALRVMTKSGAGEMPRPPDYPAGT